MRRRIATGTGASATLLILLAFILLAFIQLWYASAGTFSLRIPEAEPRYTTALYSEQARAFAHGRLHLLVDPPAALASLPDPYDPRAREALPCMHDVSYYRGRYYLYFGPVPALLLAP